MGNYRINIFIFSFLFYYVISGYVTIIKEDSKYLNQIYRNFFSISNDSMNYEANGGEYGLINALYNAFSDETVDKGWISVGSQGKKYTNPKTKIEYDSLTNNIIITFNRTSLINKMIYRAMSITHTCPIIGYPKRLKVYYRMRNEEGGFNQDENDFILADDITSNSTNKTVLFNFDNTIKCDQIKLEWNETSYCKNMYERKASAAEIKLLFPETETINENIINAFTDYNRFTLSKEFDDKKFINQLKVELNTLDFTPYPKKFIERIEGVFNGSIMFNPKREFVTSQSGKSNLIYQRGNIYSYARNKLLISRAGTNRQITGIYGRTNESITVYVSVDDYDTNTPLPCLVFSQFAGNRVNWKGKENCLKIGEQTLIFDDFNVENYKDKVNPGGPIYIINPYMQEEQSPNVKIYIDDGILFPVFRLDDNEEDYMEDLKHYYFELYNFNQDTYEDITELVSDNIMISVRASDAYKLYSDKNKGPQENLLAWDSHLKKIYSFYGIQMNRNEKGYDLRNKYINIHLRFNQLLETYAVTEYIGIHSDEWIEKSLYILGQETDWNLSCEIADMMDIRETYIFQILNKFTAKYTQIAIKGEENNDQNYLYEEKLNYLTVDEVENNMRGCVYDDTKKCKGFLQNKLNNYLIFWDLESYSHGFWAKVQNLYRNEYELTTKLTSSERMVYFCSVAMGLDLGYYFTRWGFYLEGLRDTIFNETKTSKDYQNLISQDISSGKIEKKIKKFWYLDNKEYNFMNGNRIGCYEDKVKYNIQIEKVSGYNGGYAIELPNIECREHLGFEIYENDKLIGFSYGREYIDNTIYENNYTPKYNIIAYDRLLLFSEPSEYKSP